MIKCVAGHGTLIDELRLPELRATEVHHAPGLAIASHAHDVPKLVVVLAGGASERHGLEVVDAAVFEVTARPRFLAHENQYHGRGAHSLIVECDALADPRSPPGALDRATARRLGARLVAAFRGERTGRARRMRRAVDDVAQALRAARPPSGPAWLDAAREQLFAQIAAPPTLAELGDRVGVHPVHLAQAFRARWQTTPQAYVRAHRVFRAVEQIAAGGALAEVAAATGFADQSHMTRCIHRARQAPPGALRRAMRHREP